jgi:pimeloyl-ACP methyl ester carboxylesterase
MLFAAALLGAAAASFVPSPDGVKLAYEVQGKGEPALVLVHCWGCNRGFWKDTTALLKGEPRAVLSLDLPGHGESGANRTAWTIEAFGEDVAAVVRKAGFKRVILVGHSMGGDVVVEAARKLKKETAGVILVDTLLDVDDRTPPEETARRLALFKSDFKGTVETTSRQFLFRPQTKPELVASVTKTIGDMDPAVATACLESAWTYDPRPALKEISVPIRAINGDLFPTNIPAFRKYASKYSVTILPGTSHYPMLEVPETFTSLLKAAVTAIVGEEPSKY